MARTHRLRVKQALFIEHFLSNGGRATAAARSAGYRHPGIASHKLLASDYILAPIVAALANAGDDGQQILGKLCRGSRSDVIRLRVDLILKALARGEPVARKQGPFVSVEGTATREFTLRMVRQFESDGADFGARSGYSDPQFPANHSEKTLFRISDNQVEAVSVAATHENTR